MGFSQDYSHVPDWVEKPEGYQTSSMVKYEGNVFIANFWASKPGEGEADKNGWRLYDELYDVTSSPVLMTMVKPTWLTGLLGLTFAKGVMHFPPS